MSVSAILKKEYTMRVFKENLSYEEGKVVKLFFALPNDLEWRDKTTSVGFAEDLDGANQKYYLANDGKSGFVYGEDKERIYVEDNKGDYFAELNSKGRDAFVQYRTKRELNIFIEYLNDKLVIDFDTIR
jgi:hypothetical protein